MKRPLTILLALAVTGCPRGSRNLPLGGDLRSLPHAGSQPLLAFVPRRAELAATTASPRLLWASLHGTALVHELDSAGLLANATALPPLERWRALHARLSELARTTLPGLDALLDAPAAAAWVRAGPTGSPGGALYVARFDEGLPVTWSLAQALNAVRASGRDVEVRRVRGLPIRDVAIGGGDHVAYAVLADRLLVATNVELASEALELALGGPKRALATAPFFTDLEQRGAVDGVAATWMPPQPETWAPGITRADLDGARLQLQLSPAFWAAGAVAVATNADALVDVSLAGLDLRAWLATAAAASAVSADVAAVLERAKAAAATLDRGAFAEVVPSADGLGVSLDAVRAPSAGKDADAVWEALANVLLDEPKEAEATPGGTRWCSGDDDLCVQTCPGLVRLTWPGSFARGRDCRHIERAASPELGVAVRGEDFRARADVTQGRAQLSWVSR